MNQTYEKALDAIEFYQIHPEYKPFIGEKYDEFRILQVGESHYIGQRAKDPEDDFPIQYFDKWWTDSCDELRQHQDRRPSEGLWGGWYDTRDVINRFLNARSNGGYSIFANMLRSFDRVYLNKETVHMNEEVKKHYQYFAFMNFFQMPSLYEGKKYWDSLLKSAQKQGNEQLAYQLWEKATEISANTLDAVIDVLKPEVVVITSVSAYDAYHSIHGDDPKVIRATHPCCSWWNRKHGKDNLSGRERLEKKLIEIRTTRK